MNRCLSPKDFREAICSRHELFKLLEPFEHLKLREQQQH